MGKRDCIRLLTRMRIFIFATAPIVFGLMSTVYEPMKDMESTAYRKTPTAPTLGSQLGTLVAIKLLENSLLNQMNMAIVENVNVLNTCIEAVENDQTGLSMFEQDVRRGICN